MKQLRWVGILAAAVAVLTGVFFAVDAHTKKEKERAEIGAAKTLFSFSPDIIERVSVDNEDGHFTFAWNAAEQKWNITEGEQFNLNDYAVNYICNYFCTLNSLKTVAFDCKDTAVYGLDHPVTLKVYTTETGADSPYVLYVGDCTPTYDAYYAMTDASDDVYTIDYASGSVFCVAKDTLKNLYLFDVSATELRSIVRETDGVTDLAFRRDEKDQWHMEAPIDLPVRQSEMSTLTADLVRITLDSFVEENPDDLAQYGLEKPVSTLRLTARLADGMREEEILFGNTITSGETETLMYGYFTKSRQVFRIGISQMYFLNADPVKYLEPYCLDISLSGVRQIDIDMGEIYDMHETLLLDTDTRQYSLGETDITATESTDLISQFEGFLRSISMLQFTALDPDAVPEGEPAMRIVYTEKDGTVHTEEFVQKAENDFWLLVDGKYDGRTVRLNRFTGSGCPVPVYETLIQSMKNAEVIP